MPEDQNKEFPKDFLWGASVSGHQVEGDSHDQWTVWENANAERLARDAKRLLLEQQGDSPVWDEVKKQAQDPKNYISGKGVDHYNRYEHDFKLLKELNLNSFRFTIEWSRIEPEEGQIDQKEIEHYHRYIKALKRHNIEPVLNIWHWTVPVWFEQRGGFKYYRNLKYFENFVKLLAKEYSDDLKYVITLNEPNVYSTFSYKLGWWPPQQTSTVTTLRVYGNLVRAHKLAYSVLKKEKPSLQVGVATQFANIQAKDPHQFFDEVSTKLMRYGWNWWFLNRIKHHQDFVGMNYYFTDYYNGLFKRDNPNKPLNNMGWYMEPEGLYPILLRAWSHYKKPIIITENGVADFKDEYRRWWLEETIVAMEKAASEGVKIRGYFHWSLLDNFEWSVGWWPRFGLIAVDRQDGMRRSIRSSAKWFAKRIAKLS